MSDEKKYSERDVVKLKRAAFEAGGRFAFDESLRGGWPGYPTMARESNARYVMPSVTRPRVVDDPEAGYNQPWRVVNGALQFGSWDATRWYNYDDAGRIDRSSVPWPTAARIKLWADLLANPTETVPEDE